MVGASEHLVAKVAVRDQYKVKGKKKREREEIKGRLATNTKETIIQLLFIFPFLSMRRQFICMIRPIR